MNEVNPIYSTASTIAPTTPIRSVSIEPPGMSIVAPKIENTRVRVIYDFKSRRGLDLSQRERLVCDVFLNTRSLSFCRGELKRVFKKDVQERSIKKWMEREHVRGYLDSCLLDRGYLNGWTKEKWVRECSERMTSPVKDGIISGFYLKLIGQALGYMEMGINIKDSLVQVRVTQQNGEV